VIRGLHDNAPKRVTTLCVAATETMKVKGFHPEPKHGEDNHNDAPKRVMTPTGIAAIGAKTLSFRSEKSLHRSRELSRPLPPSKVSEP
jgi:hypothetical protein